MIYIRFQQRSGLLQNLEPCYDIHQAESVRERSFHEFQSANHLSASHILRVSPAGHSGTWTDIATSREIAHLRNRVHPLVFEVLQNCPKACQIRHLRHLGQTAPFLDLTDLVEKLLVQTVPSGLR